VWHETGMKFGSSDPIPSAPRDFPSDDMSKYSPGPFVFVRLFLFSIGTEGPKFAPRSDAV
jgi:hypothetical protein